MALYVKSERVRWIPSKEFRESGRKHYYVRIFLDADVSNELNEVLSVQYELHPTFRDRYRNSVDRATEFETNIWSYGFFNVKARVLKKDSTTQELVHFVRWDTGS